MAEAWTVTLRPSEDWRWLGSTPEKAPVEVVVRSFDGPVLFATGSTQAKPDAPPLAVGAGSGGRLEGLHFFAKSATSSGPCRILVRGV